MTTITLAQPLTEAEIDAQTPDSTGTTAGHIYVSIPYYAHQVFKGLCCGVMNGTLRQHVEHIRAAHPGCEVRVYRDDMSPTSRIHADGSPHSL